MHVWIDHFFEVQVKLINLGRATTRLLIYQTSKQFQVDWRLHYRSQLGRLDFGVEVCETI